MADNRNELPEGTDKIIAGASVTTGVGGEDGELLAVADTSVATIASPATGSTSGGASPGSENSGGKSSGGNLFDKLRSSGGTIGGQAADKARGLVGQGMERSAEALANVSRMVGDTAAGLDERLGQDYGDMARRAASAIEGAADSIASKDADALIDDTRKFVRKSPAVALAGAAVVGFVLARLVKSGLAAGDDPDDKNGGGGSRGSTRA